MNYYTTIEQSKKLLELGLNPNTADMWYEDGSLFIARLGRIPKEMLIQNYLVGLLVHY